MKKLLLFAACGLLASAVRAQTTTLAVENNMGCYVYIELYGDNGCGLSASTGVIAVPNGTHWTSLTPSSFSSWTPFTPTHFTGGRLYQGNPALCPPGFMTVGEPCTGLPNTAPIQPLNSSCNVCAPGTLPWTEWIASGAPSHFIVHP